MWASLVLTFSVSDPQRSRPFHQGERPRNRFLM
jgi:hypothetical protein